MSFNLTPNNVEFRVKVGDRASLVLTFTDSNGDILDLTNTTTYASGKWKVWNPAGTLLINGTIVFTTRASGIITYTLTADDTLAANEGIWAGEVEIKDTNGVITEQSRTFKFVIEESY